MFSRNTKKFTGILFELNTLLCELLWSSRTIQNLEEIDTCEIWLESMPKPSEYVSCQILNGENCD